MINPPMDCLFEQGEIILSQYLDFLDIDHISKILGDEQPLRGRWKYFLFQFFLQFNLLKTLLRKLMMEDMHTTFTKLILVLKKHFSLL